MVRKKFLYWHFMALLSCLLFVAIQFFIPGISKYIDLSILSMVLFLVFSIFLYLVALQFVDHPNKFLFGNIILASTFVKIVMSVIFVFVYFYFSNPSSKVFILPFFVIYLIFTVFETIFLVQINQSESGKGSV